jgi:hypothetical protein
VAGDRRPHLQTLATARGGAGSVRRSFGARRRDGVGTRCGGSVRRSFGARRRGDVGTRCGGPGGAAAAAWGHGLRRQRQRRGGTGSGGGGVGARARATATLQRCLSHAMNETAKCAMGKKKGRRGGYIPPPL